jgi:hypothetical protein
LRADSLERKIHRSVDSALGRRRGESVRLDLLSWSELVTRAKQAEAAAARSDDADIKAEWLQIARCYREMADQQIQPPKAPPE